MPEVQHYIVKQTREVRVAALNPESAALLAGKAFEKNSTVIGGMEEGLEKVWGEVEKFPKIVGFEMIRE